MSPTPTSLPGYGAARIFQTDRRGHQRYPIDLKVEYKLIDGIVQRQGFGRTVNISSSGLLLELEDTLPIPGSIELWIKWPFLLDGSVPLKFIVRGKIVRITGNSAAVEATEHEFRTRSGLTREAQPTVMACGPR